MKGLLCFALFALQCSLFTSCHDDLDVDTIANAPLLTRGYTDEQIRSQRLGYAYNAAGNVMDDNSFSVKPVINMDRLMAAESEYGLIVNSERRHYTSIDIFSGNTLQELGHEETKYTIEDDEDIGSGKYYRNGTTSYQGVWLNCYKAHMFVKHTMGTRTIDAGILHCLNLDDLSNEESVLEAEFRGDVADLVKKGDKLTEADATQFSEKYGTHLVVSSNIGGMIELQMEINSDSCVSRVYTSQKVCELVLGNEVVKTAKSQVLSEASTMNVQYHGQVNVKGGLKEDCDAMHRTFDEERAEKVKVSDGDYYGWATRISMDPETYNATFTGGRFLPFYELFEDETTRGVMRQVYKLYMKKEAPAAEVYEPPYGVLAVKGNYGPDVRVASSGTEKACIICEEYVPSIRSDKACIVAYPLLRDTAGNYRPLLFSGLFIGDESHRPGYVSWEGSASRYEPCDSIFAESDSASIRNLFDPETHALKNVYFYWNAVHPMPCPTKRDQTPVAYKTTVFTAQPEPLAQSTTFAKVARNFWSVRPVVVKTDSLLPYWNEDKKFENYVTHKYNTYGGTIYKDSSNYYFVLLDGADNIKRAPVRVGDPGARKQWNDAVSKSMKAIGLYRYLPSAAQSRSITKMLGNRMSIFYERESNGRNMLGLDWPTGYYANSLPESLITVNWGRCDGQGMPIVTNDVGEVCILRLSGSGTDLTLEFPEYVCAFNYSDQMFLKYFPIYITTDTF